jgi:hypothetical protein
MILQPCKAYSRLQAARRTEDAPLGKSDNSGRSMKRRKSESEEPIQGYATAIARVRMWSNRADKARQAGRRLMLIAVRIKSAIGRPGQGR